MSEQEKTEGGAETPTPATTEAKEKKIRVGKEAIYEQIAEFVLGKTEKRIGISGGQIIFNMVVDGSFALAVKEGTMRFNGGYGSLHVREYGAGKRKLPSGQEVKFGTRTKVRYEEGVSVKALLGNGGTKAPEKKTTKKQVVDLT